MIKTSGPHGGHQAHHVGENTVKKQSLRSEFLALRDSIGIAEVRRLSQVVQRSFMDTPEFSQSKKLALYASCRNEVGTYDILTEAIRLGKEVCFPRTIVKVKDKKEGSRIAFFKVGSRDELVPGCYDIPEPPVDAGREYLPDEFDLIVVPGIAFDMKGTRLGYGKGYYDRALARVKCPVVAIAFNAQILKIDLPCEPHDVGVDMIVTEDSVIRGV